MKDNLSLLIVCPVQKKPRALLLCSVGMALSGYALARQWDNASILFSAVAGMMMAVLAAIMYRNLFFRDALCITRKGAAAPASGQWATAEEIVAVRRRENGGAFSSEARREAAGLNLGPIEIETRTDTFYFGVGLSEYSIDETIDRITVFCGLDRGSSDSAVRQP